MSQFRLKVQPTRNYYEDENTDPNPEPQVPKSQAKSSKNFFSQFTSPSIDYKSMSKIQDMNSNQKSDTELSHRKFTDNNNSFYNTLSEDFLCTLSKVGSHIITSDLKLNQGSLEQLSFENILSPVGNFTLSKMSDTKALFHQEMRAVKFSRHREYLKAFLGLRVWADVGKRTRKFFRDYIEMQHKKELIDVIFDLKKLSSYRKLTMQHKPKPQKIQRVLPASLTNLSYDVSYQGYETEPDELEENAILYYKHILAKKALNALKQRRYYKNLNAKATKFLYYKLLLKYTYKWIDNVKQAPKTVSSRQTTKITTENTPNHRFYSVPSNNSLYKKSSYTVSSLTDIDEEEPYGQIYSDRLISKSFHSLRFHLDLQKKKKNLEEVLLNCLGMRYVAKPFQAWLCLARVNKMKKKAANQMRNILLQNLFRDAFSNIKQAKRIPLMTRITTKRVPGIILRQGSVPPRERNLNSSTVNVQQQFEASFKNLNQERRENKENKENLSILSNNQRPKTQRTFRNYLDGIFPHSKKDQQQDSTSHRHLPQFTENTASSNSIFVMQNLIPQTQTEDSINMATLDTSHFGIADKSNIQVEENRYLSKFFDKASPIKPNRAVLDQSFFGLNVSQIPDKENKIIEEEVVKDPKKSESFMIQKQLQSSYYSRQNMRKGGNRAQHNRTFSSGNLLSKETNNNNNNNNSSFSILQEMKKDERRSTDREQKSSKLNRSFDVRTMETEEDKKNNVSMRVERTRDTSKEYENKKSMYKETRQKGSNQFKQMISELENHLSFLNRNLLNQKLINNKLSHIKGHLSTDKR